MKRSKFSEEQIIGILNEQEVRRMKVLEDENAPLFALMTGLCAIVCNN